ncbi:hypothetical protein MYX77_03950 [Acidobacteriia bacterium AH_259_A11_L15]|nr:hypothetical protein [Acidobacteriia bacterium AH_259_A11_L15]
MAVTDERTSFSEWILNEALASYFGTGDDQNERMEWFFSLSVLTPEGKQAVRELAGFEWTVGEIEWAFNRGLRVPEDRGGIAQELFEREYWGLRPDFRFWRRSREAQLIVESKGYDPGGGKQESDQARRYFQYLKDFACRGAVIYLVPRQATRCLEMLQAAGEKTGVSFGVLHWEDLFDALGTDLLRVVARSMVASAEVLKTALKLIEPSSK